MPWRGGRYSARDPSSLCLNWFSADKFGFNKFLVQSERYYTYLVFMRSIFTIGGKHEKDSTKGPRHQDPWPSSEKREREEDGAE
jgi:hypothetical protein